MRPRFVSPLDEFIKAISDKWNELNPGKGGGGATKKVRVLVLGHGSSGSGPLIGPADGVPVFNFTVANWDELADYRPEEFDDKLSKMPISRIKDMVDEMRFASCAIANTAGGKHALRNIARYLGMTNIAAATWHTNTSFLPNRVVIVPHPFEDPNDPLRPPGPQPTTFDQFIFQTKD